MNICCLLNENNICRVYFSAKLNEIEKLGTPRIPEFEYSDMVAYKSACLKLSVAMVNMALNKNGIKCLATRDTKFFNNSNPQIPFMGVTKVYILDEDFKLSLPLGLNNSVKEEIDNLSQTIEKDFEDVLIKIGLFYQESTEIVCDNSQVFYNLHYKKDGVIINTLKNQLFDMNEDNDIDKNLFLGAQVGDRIIINSDDVIIEAEILSVISKIPYSKTRFDVNNINELGYISLEDMYDDFEKSYYLLNKVEIIYNYIVDYAMKNTNFKISKELRDIFTKNNPENDSVELDIYHDIFNTLYCLNEEYLEDESCLIPSFEELGFYYRTGAFDIVDIIDYFSKKNVINNLIKMNLIKGIKL